MELERSCASVSSPLHADCRHTHDTAHPRPTRALRNAPLSHAVGSLPLFWPRTRPPLRAAVRALARDHRTIALPMERAVGLTAAGRTTVLPSSPRFSPRPCSIRVFRPVGRMSGRPFPATSRNGSLLRTGRQRQTTAADSVSLLCFPMATDLILRRYRLPRTLNP